MQALRPAEGKRAAEARPAEDASADAADDRGDGAGDLTVDKSAGSGSGEALRASVGKKESGACNCDSGKAVRPRANT